MFDHVGAAVTAEEAIAADSFQPLHQVAIPHIGLLLGEMFVLDELAAACHAGGCFEMLLAAGPIPVRGGVGAPVNPIAVR
jgi:hypothetical protein